MTITRLRCLCGLEFTLLPGFRFHTRQIGTRCIGHWIEEIGAGVTTS